MTGWPDQRRCGLAIAGWLLAASAVMQGPSSAVAQGAPPGQSLSFTNSTLSFGSEPLAFPSQLARLESAGTIEIILPADVLFDFDKADILPKAEQILREVSAMLVETRRQGVTITGHTDAIGSDAYNQSLSERRADAVRKWLVAHEGKRLPPVTTSGRGARDPMAPNKKPDGSDDPQGRALNRRVTLVIRK